MGLGSIKDKLSGKKGAESNAVTGGPGAPGAQGAPGTPRPRRRKRPGLTKIIIFLIIIGAVGGGAYYMYSKKQAEAAATETSTSNVGYVERGSISNELTSSGTLEPKDTYTITSLVSGEILQADFEEGDQVEKDQVLYVIDQSDIEQNINSADRNLTTAQTNYQEAVDDYNEAIENLGGGTVRSKQTGYVQNLTVQEDDTLGGQGETTIADLYDDTAMTLWLAFLNTDADALQIGQDMYVEISDTGEVIPGRVEEKSDLLETINSGTLVKYVKVLVSNPGGLTTSDHGIAYMGDIISLTDNTFEPYESYELKVDLPSSVKIAQMLVNEGQYVTTGTALFTLTADSLADALQDAEDTLTQAENNLIDAENQVSSMADTADKYTLTAPISGQVITKDYKVGDKISDNSSSSTASLALIYDLSELTFEMSIDELDITNIQVGQEVVVTADAFEDETFSGHVTNVSLAGTASNGVTTYPVVVTLDETGNLLPGMNVDGVIILESAEDTLYIPSGALQRGNIVYVKTDSLTGEEETEASAESSGQGSGGSGEGGRTTGDGEGSGGESEDGRPEGGPGGDGERPEGGPGGDGEMPEGGPGGGGGTPPEDMGQGSGSSDASGSGSGSGSGSASSSGSAAEFTLAEDYNGDVPEGYTAVVVETGIISTDYVEILSGLTEGQEVYVKNTVSTTTVTDMMGMGGMGGGPDGGGMGGSGGGHNSGGGGGGFR